MSVKDPLNPTLANQRDSSAFGRQEKNHPRPKASMVINECPLAFCDWEYLVCVQNEAGGQVNMFTCCDAANPMTRCDNPPCWFKGGKCPRQPAEEDEESHQRRLQRRHSPQGKLGSKDKHADFDWDWKWSEDLGYSSLFAAKRANESGGNASRNSLFSAEDLLDIDGRRLTTINFTSDQAVEERIQLMEDDETPVLARVQEAILTQEREKEWKVRAKARRELIYAQLPPNEARLARNAHDSDEAFIQDQVMELERQFSQLITRSSVLRDTICKQAIVQLTSTEPPLRFENAAFIIYLGKTRNLSDARPSLAFPDRFVVPPTAPDEPTPDNPVTAFSFIYVEYKKNIYGWSASSPPGNESNIITLIVMKASTKELDISNETEPIRVFADVSLYSSALCMYWDRFAPNTAGGGWSTQGIINDGEGCLTTHLSDIALFIDGRIPQVFSVEKAKSYYLEETIDGPENQGTNYLTIAVVGFVLLLGTILALAGYIQDEGVRERQRKEDENSENKGVKNRYHLKGDGVTEPLNVDDAIAYKHVEKRWLFLTLTFWKVVLRDHALLGALLYHQTFTRPQRILCLGVMVTGILSLNAVIYGIPNLLVQDDQFVASGIISGLVVFPLFVACIFMFSARPTLSRQRIIKRQTNFSEVQAMQSAKLEIEQKSSKMPDLPALPAPTQAPLGSTTLLSLPPPGAHLLPPKAPGPLALPAPGGMTFPATMPALPPPSLPPGMGAPMATGLPALPGLPSLPPLPVLKAGPPGSGLMALPPPPKHPSPLMRYSVLRAGLPAPGDGERQELAAPPPPPPPPGAAAIADREQTALPGAFVSDPRHQATPPDLEADEGAARELSEEAQHGAPPGTPPLPPLRGEPPMAGTMTPPRRSWHPGWLWCWHPARARWLRLYDATRRSRNTTAGPCRGHAGHTACSTQFSRQLCATDALEHTTIRSKRWRHLTWHSASRRAVPDPSSTFSKATSKFHVSSKSTSNADDETSRGRSSKLAYRVSGAPGTAKISKCVHAPTTTTSATC